MTTSSPQAPRVWGRGQDTNLVYVVEARTTAPTPRQHGRMLLDNRWQQVQTTHDDHGIPVNVYPTDAQSHGFLNYEAAMGLAYWYMALGSSYSIQARLVQIRFEHSYTATEVGVGPPLEPYEDQRVLPFTEREEKDA